MDCRLACTFGSCSWANISGTGMIVAGMPEIECKRESYNIECCMFGLVCTIACTLDSFVLGSMLKKAYILENHSWANIPGTGMIVAGMPEIECKREGYNIECCMFELVCTIACTLDSFVLGSMLKKAYILENHSWANILGTGMIVAGMPEIECKREDYNIECCMFGLVCTIACTLDSFVLGSMSVLNSDKIVNKADIFDTVDSWEGGCRKVLTPDT